MAEELDQDGGSSALGKRAFISSGIWAVTYFLLQILRIVSQIILASLLSPHAFGIVRIGTAVIQGLRMCSEVGVRESIVRDEQGDEPTFLNTAWTFQIIRGVLIWVVAMALAWPIASIYDEPSLLLILPALATVPLMAGFNSTAFIQLNRLLREGPRALLELSSALVSSCAMVAWAYFVSQDAWALVIGSVAGGIIFLIVSHRLPGDRNRLMWDTDAAQKIWGFGAWIFVGTVIAFLGQQLDSFMLGKFDAVSVLGVYFIASTVARLPNEIMSVISVHVLYPVFSSINRDSPEQFTERLLQIRSLVLPVAASAVVGVVMVSPWFFTVFYDDRYADAVWIAPLICASAWVLILNSPVNRALLTLGRTRQLAFIGLVKVIAMAILAPIGFMYAGVAGFIVGVFVATAIEHALSVVYLAVEGINVVGQDLRETTFVAAFAIAAVAGNTIALQQDAPGTTITLGLAIVACAGMASGLRTWLRWYPLLKESLLGI